MYPLRLSGERKTTKRPISSHFTPSDRCKRCETMDSDDSSGEGNDSFESYDNFMTEIIMEHDTSTESFIAFKANMVTLLSMGFDEYDAESALLRSKNDLATAMEAILAKNEERSDEGDDWRGSVRHGLAHVKIERCMSVEAGSSAYFSNGLQDSKFSQDRNTKALRFIAYKRSLSEKNMRRGVLNGSAIGTNEDGEKHHVPKISFASVESLKVRAQSFVKDVNSMQAFDALFRNMANERSALKYLIANSSAGSNEAESHVQIASKPQHETLGLAETHCGICWDTLSEEQTMKMPGCAHTFCKECVAQWLHRTISDGRIYGSALRCPLVAGKSCTADELIKEEVEAMIMGTVAFHSTREVDTTRGVDKDDIELQMDGSEGEIHADDNENSNGLPPLLVKYRKYMENRALEQRLGVRWCITQGCETPIMPTVLNTLFGKRKMTCNNCKNAVCRSCGRAYHGWGTCEDATDALWEEYRKTQHLQPCPSCRRMVDKMNACPHMTCTVCGHQWCWVCRGNYPCSTLHFGTSGYGSAQEIGDVRRVQQLAVLMRMCSIIMCLPLLAIILAIGIFGWAVGVCLPCVLFVGLLIRQCRHGDACEWEFRDGAWNHMYKLARYAYRAIGLVVIGALIIALVGILVALTHCLGALSFPFVLGFLIFDAVMACNLSSSSDRREYVSCMNFKLDVRDAVRFDLQYTKKGGKLSLSTVRTWRILAACVCFTLFFGPALVVSTSLSPLAPCLLIPIAISPRAEIPRSAALLLGPLTGLVVALVLYLVVGIDWYLGMLCGFVACVAMVFFLLNPPLSNCSFCAPTWLMVYSIPLTLIVGEEKARKYLAFAPVPDFPLQAPLLLLLFIIGIID